MLTDEAEQTMHNMMGQIAIKHGPHHRQSSEHDDYHSNDGWGVPINYSFPPQILPIYEYQNLQPINHGMPMSPPLASHSHQQLLPLILPSHPTWPSMLTNPVSYQEPPVAFPPSLVPVKAVKLTTYSAPPRKTLTDQDRLRMCQYHEDNPFAKQTDIGAMFGVERSTVSKVLRQKEKYLFPEDRNASPVKRQKGKFPDIDRALSSWVRNSQRQGVPLTDATIKEKARVWATAVGNSESSIKANSSSWLEKFKQKNNIGGTKLLRRASETNISDASALSQDSAAPSISHTLSGHSLGSLSDLALPVSGPKADERIESETMDDYMDFSSSGYRHPGATSLSSAFTDTPATATSTISPTQNDARRALETFLNYMALEPPQGLINEAEYQTVVKLAERMRQHNLGALGSLSRIVDGDGDGDGDDEGEGEGEGEGGKIECRMSDRI